MGEDPGLVLTIKYNLAAIGCFLPGYDSQQRCFPAAGRPEKANKISSVQVQIYLVKSETIVEIFFDIHHF